MKLFQNTNSFTFTFKYNTSTKLVFVQQHVTVYYSKHFFKHTNFSYHEMALKYFIKNKNKNRKVK